MDEKHVRIISDKLDELVKTTNRLPELIGQLVESKVLNEYMVQHLHKYYDPKIQLKEFYTMMKGRGPKAFDVLISVLRATGNFRAEQLLSSHKVLSYVGVPDKVPVKPEPPADESEKIEAKFVVRTHPEGKWMDIEDQRIHPNGVYKMRSKPRGLALIININKYDRSTGYENRTGSEFDMSSLHSVLPQLGYKITSHSDLTTQEMQKEIRIFSLDPNLRNVDSLIVFIMCHGQQEPGAYMKLYAKDGGFVTTSWVQEQFNNSPFNCAGQRKPKMFFFQACRIDPSAPKTNHIILEKGTDADTSMAVTVTDGNGDMSTAKTVTDAVSLSTGDEKLYRREHEDHLIVFSTIQGYLSFRDRSEGTWFVQELCNALAEHAWEWDVETILGQVDHVVREKQRHQGIEICKQAAVHKIFLNPGLFEREDATETSKVADPHPYEVVDVIEKTTKVLSSTVII